MKPETTTQLMHILNALVAHTMYCRPRVAALEQVLRRNGPEYQQYQSALDEILSKTDYLESVRIFEELRKGLLQNHE